MPDNQQETLSYEVLLEKLNQSNARIDKLESENKEMAKIIKSLATTSSSEVVEPAEEKVKLEDIKEALLRK